MHTTHLQITVKDETLEEIDKLQKNLHAPGRSDTVRRTVDITAALSSAIKNGDKIFIESKDGKRKQFIISGLKNE